MINYYEPRCEKTGLQGFRPGLTQTGLCSYRRQLEAWNFAFRKKRDAKTKALVSCAVTAQLICALEGRSGAVDRASDFGPRGPWFNSPPVHISLWH